MATVVEDANGSVQERCTVLDLRSWGHLTKAVKVVACVWRLITNMRRTDKKKGPLDDVELAEAMVRLVRCPRGGIFS